MLDARAPTGAEPIEAKTVYLFVDFVHQSSTQHCPLRWIYFALEYRVLNPLSKALAQTSDTTQAPPTGGIASGDIVCNEHQHYCSLFPEKRWVAIEVTTQPPSHQSGLYERDETERRLFLKKGVCKLTFLSLLVRDQNRLPCIFAQ